MKRLFLLSLFAFGCEDLDRARLGFTGVDMAPPPTPTTQPLDPAVGPDGCSEAAKLVYLIDEDGTLMSFEPAKLKFTEIGKVPCSSLRFNSMAVDRAAVAWVNSEDGQVFRVNTQMKPLDCSPTSFDSADFVQFGMGFSSNAVGSSDETLFVAGPDGLASSLATLDTATMKVRVVGAMNGSWPELTGTGSAELWGFFPDSSMSKLAQIDKKSATLKREMPLPQLNGIQRAWAFAFWGGSYWIFLQRFADLSTNVWQVSFDESGTHVIEAVHNTGRTIVGAGVSTCAPVAQPG